MLEILFWSSAAFCVYAYAGYPLLAAALATLRHRPVAAADITPPVSFIITVRNEEARLPDKMANTLALDYPRDAFEVIVTSDASSDGTHAIVESFADRGVRLVVAPERRGKEAAQLLAIQHASHDLLVFSDVATHLEPDGVLRIVRSFADPAIGSVSSEDLVLRADGSTGGEGAYVRYEMWLRQIESRLGSVVGLSGSFFAARRAVCRDWAVDIPSDFTTLLNTLKAGLRGISDPRALGYYQDLADGRREYARKVRTVVRGMSALLQHLELLNPFRFGLSAWQLASHKLCRWLVPVAMVLMLIASLLLAGTSRFYAVLAVLQLVAYALAGAGVVSPVAPRGPWRILTFFVVVNASILHAWWNVLLGRRVVTWEPSRRDRLVRS